VPVPQHAVGAVIGSQGSQIKQVISQCRTAVAFTTITRLHQMHERQTIVTDVSGVCLSVYLSRGLTRLHYGCKNGRADQDPYWGEHLGAIVLDGVLIPTAKGGGLMQPLPKYFGLFFVE